MNFDEVDAVVVNVPYAIYPVGEYGAMLRILASGELVHIDRHDSVCRGEIFCAKVDEQLLSGGNADAEVFKAIVVEVSDI